MRGLRGLGLVVLLAFGLGLLPTPAAFAAGCEASLLQESTASTCEGELGWSYDPATRTFGYGSVIASATANDPYEYKTGDVCDGGMSGCPKAFNCPEKLDREGKRMAAIRMVAFRRLKADANDPWQIVNHGVCKYTGRTVPMSDVLAVGLSMKEQVGKPEIVAQPPGGVTLVNFTSLFHAPVQKDTTLTITKPVSGVITAIPHYTWDLSDGITAEGAGHPYDDQVDPKSPDSDGYYVKAFYRTRGVKNVHLTLTWEVSIHLEGFGVVPLAPIVLTADTTTTAKTSHARLVGP
jgi:hypothetical protein